MLLLLRPTSPGKGCQCKKMFSKTFGYALRAVAQIALPSNAGRKIGMPELAASLDIPQHFLAKIMQDMVRHGIVGSAKGPTGGFYAIERTAQIPILTILEITDGSMVFDTCALGIQHCNALTPCPLHHDFAACRNGMRAVFSTKTVGMLADEVEVGRAFLMR
jgi:Rrf2 family protein